MKNGLLVWNVVLTLITGYLLISHFSSGKKSVSRVEPQRVDDTTSFSAAPVRLAYFEMDSIEAHYEMVKDIKFQVTKKEDDMKAELEKLGRDYQNKLSFYQNKQAEMSRADIENAGMELKGLEDRYNNRKMELERSYADFSLKSTQAIKTRIEEFIREFNKTRNYSYIIAEEPGFFYYKDTTQNITSEVLKGLNEDYRASKKSK